MAKHTQFTAAQVRSISKKYADEYDYQHGTGKHGEPDDRPDCDCGWRGRGTGPGGRFIKGDRCPNCGESLS